MSRYRKYRRHGYVWVLEGEDVPSTWVPQIRGEIITAAEIVHFLLTPGGLKRYRLKTPLPMWFIDKQLKHVTVYGWRLYKIQKSN